MKNRSLKLDAPAYQVPDNFYPGLIQLHLNENSFSSALSTASSLDDVSSYVDVKELHLYPERGCAALKETLSSYIKCPIENIAISHGSSNLLRLLFAYLLREDDVVLLPSPSWAFYNYTSRLVRAKSVFYPLKQSSNKFEYDVSILHESIQKHRPQVVIICSPNNPTGLGISDDDLIAIVSKNPMVNFIVDQAYYGFTQSDNYHDIVAIESTCRHNLYITRSLSKFMALANLRIGYLVCNSDCSKNLSASATVFGIPSYSQRIAARRVIDLNKHKKIRKEYSIVRNYLHSEINKINGLKPYVTDANFMLIQHDNRWGDLRDSLLQHGFVVKREIIDGKSDFIRVTLSNIRVMSSFIEVINYLDGIKQ
jgi:histidinol-phosphate aminotransferase